MPPEIEEDNNLPDEPVSTEGEVLDNTGADELDNDEADDASLEDTLDKELENLRAGEGDDRTDEEKVADEVTADTEAAADGESGDEEQKPDQDEEQTTATKEADQGESDQEVDDDPDAELLSGMKDRTRERFTEMRSENKQLNEQMDDLQNGRQELHNVILESTATTQQLSGALGLFKMINSGDSVGAQNALGELKQLYNAVAQVAGQPEMGGDPLQNHPDLKKAVEDLDMSQDNAEEMARMRLQQFQQQQRQQKVTQQQQQTAHSQQNAQTAAGDIKSWEDGLLSSDPDYKLIQPKLVEVSRQIMQNTPPEQWLQLLQHEYDSMHQGLALANRQQQKTSPSPIRPDTSSAAGSFKKDTKDMSMDDLLSSSLANMRG